MNWREYQRRQQVAEIGERFVSYLDEGGGPPVILIHGIPTWGYEYHHLAGELQRFRRVIVPDLLGFGYSDKRDCFDRSIARQAEMIVALLDKLHIRRADIVGHDIGGGVALRLATLFPERVDRLCVMNTVAYDSWPIEAMLQFGHPDTRTKASAGKTMAGMKQALKQGISSETKDDILDALLVPYSTEVGKISLVRNAAALNTNLTTEVTHLLPGVASPTLVLWGEEDQFQLLRFGERLAADIPKANLVRVPDASHFLMLDQPDVVAGHLRGFLEKQDS